MVAKERGHTSNSELRSQKSGVGKGLFFEEMRNVSELNDNFGKKEQILEAAIKVFANKGFYNAKVEEIAFEAKVGKGTVYEYFKSKQDLFQEMFKYILSLYFERFVAEISKKCTFKEKIAHLLESHLRFILEHRDMAQIFLSEYPPLDEDFRNWVITKKKQMLNLLEKNIVDGIDKKQIHDVNPSLISSVVAGVITYFGNNEILNGKKIGDSELSELAADTTNLIFRGIGCD